MSPNGRDLATAWSAFRTGGVNVDFVIGDLTRGTQKFICSGHTDVVVGIVFSPDGKRLVSSGWDNTVREWDVETGRETACWTGGQTGGPVTISPDGKSLAVGGMHGMFEIWDVTTRAVGATITVNKDQADALAISPDGQLVATAANTTKQRSPSFGGVVFGSITAGDVELWDLNTGNSLAMLQEAGPSAWSLAFSQDGKWFAVGDENGMISIWDVAKLFQQDAKP